MNKLVVLIILDGWGLAPPGPGNAISLAKTPNFNKFWSVFPKTQLLASEEAVGLPRGERGNSETGHLNLGAGHIVFQDLPRIDMAIDDESFFLNPAFKMATNHVKKNHSSLHLLGLIGAGGVHSSLRHLSALIRFAKKEKVKNVYLHLFTDGRDSPPTSAPFYLAKIEKELKENQVGRIATLCGRYYGMDRDNRWDRTEKAYNLLTLGVGIESNSAIKSLKNSYASGKTDEFIEPTVLDKNGIIKDNDAVIFFNFRIDRPRQLTKAFVLPDFETMKTEKIYFDPYAERYGLKAYEFPKGTSTFQRKKILKNLFFVTMTEYEKGLPVKVAFPPQIIKMPLARVLAENNLRQLHISETEKERFVTYYFNGQRDYPFPGEDWIEIPSPKVPTYDKKPEMSAFEITSQVVKRIQSKIYNFVLINFANPDMVGHTGVIKAGIKACEAVDKCLEEIVKTVLAQEGSCIITADHGNIEEMINLKTGEIDTEHSLNPVPFVVINQKLANGGGKLLSSGGLADVAPTILALFEIQKPETMIGKNLLQ